MAYEESSARKKSQQYFRTSMDIGMGIFYIVIGGMVLIYRSFAEYKIPPAVAYILGAMMLIGGGFRLYRGLKVVLPKKADANAAHNSEQQ